MLILAIFKCLLFSLSFSPQMSQYNDFERVFEHHEKDEERCCQHEQK
jgi:hypothetical protein